MFNTIFKWFLRAVLLVWYFFMFILGMWIWSENKMPVTVNYLGIEFEDQTLGFVICLMLAVGGTLGFLTSYFTVQVKLLIQKYRYDKVQKEFTKLKNTQQHE